MKRLTLTIAALAFASSAFAAMPVPAAVAAVHDHVVVAHDQRIDVFEDGGASALWSTEGVDFPSAAIGSEKYVAILDSLRNTIRLVDLQSRSALTISTGESPVGAAFVGTDLFVLERDDSRLARYDANGRRTAILALEPDPAYLRVREGLLYVYSRGDGIVQEIAPDRMAVTRRVILPPAASDFEIDGSTGYLAYPREAKVRTFARDTFTTNGEMAAGAVPVDIELAGAPNAIAARRLAIADPSSKRVWLVEGKQSVAQAFFRGFLRGFIGLGGASRSSSFPTGVDRVFAAGSTLFGYDTSSATLYRVKGKKANVVATGVSPAAIDKRDGAIFAWTDGRVRLLR